MNWTEIWGWVNQQWAGIASTGAFGLIAIKSFVIDKIGSVRKIENFDALKDVITTDNELTNTKTQLVYDKLELTMNKFDEIIKQNNVIIEQNEQMKNLTIQALSVANVPLQAKESFFGGLNGVVQANEKVMATFKQSIDLQKVALQAKETITNNILDKVKEV